VLTKNVYNAINIRSGAAPLCASAWNLEATGR
jgi:hypothetical protein